MKFVVGDSSEADGKVNVGTSSSTRERYDLLASAELGHGCEDSTLLSLFLCNMRNKNPNVYVYTQERLCKNTYL